MTEAVFLERIYELVPQGRRWSVSRALRLAAQAVRAYPRSARLLILLGDLISTLPDAEYDGYTPIKLYRRAIRYEPRYWEGYEAAGFYQYVDGAYGDRRSLKKAEDLLRRAIRLGGGHDSFLGLGSVLIEQGRYSAARRALQKCTRRNDPSLQDCLRELEEKVHELKLARVSKKAR
jgi:tetratricopeptide (TPR) repeat protein